MVTGEPATDFGVAAVGGQSERNVDNDDDNDNGRSLQSANSPDQQ
jgi:hypothetical protein